MPTPRRDALYSSLIHAPRNLGIVQKKTIGIAVVFVKMILESSPLFVLGNGNDWI